MTITRTTCRYYFLITDTRVAGKRANQLQVQCTTTSDCEGLCLYFEIPMCHIYICVCIRIWNKMYKVFKCSCIYFKMNYWHVRQLNNQSKLLDFPVTMIVCLLFNGVLAVVQSFKDALIFCSYLRKKIHWTFLMLIFFWKYNM